MFDEVNKIIIAVINSHWEEIKLLLPDRGGGGGGGGGSAGPIACIKSNKGCQYMYRWGNFQHNKVSTVIQI